MNTNLYVSFLTGTLCVYCLTLSSQNIPGRGYYDSFVPEAVKAPLNRGNIANDAMRTMPQNVAAHSEELEDSEEFDNVLNFWFGSLIDPTYFPEDKLAIWFTETPEVDRQLKDNFSDVVVSALKGDYNYWRETPRGRLALIVLLDQFPRHIYRGTTQAYMFDRMAKGLVLEGLQNGDDEHLYPIERAFFYLPLQHVENIETQNLAVSLYRKLLADAPRPIKPQMEAFLEYALLHREQIALFGRFPHRNAILGRKSTPEETIFLKQWGNPPFRINRNPPRSENNRVSIYR